MLVFVLILNGDDLKLPEISPEIHDVSDLKGLSPRQFIDVLKARGCPEYTFDAKLSGWITKKDVRDLLPLVDSKEPCSSVALSISSFYSVQPSTVGDQALYLLEGLKKGNYPDQLNLNGPFGSEKVELIKWAKDQLRADH